MNSRTTGSYVISLCILLMFPQLLFGQTAGDFLQTDKATPKAIAKPQSRIGEREKIRLFWCQWQHFAAGGVTDEELVANIANVGGTVMGDWGFSPERARLCHQHGMKYFVGYATARLRGPAEAKKMRLAVDNTGRTCLERFDAYVKDGGDPNKPWGFWGEGKGAYVPCPLLREPWNESFINGMIELAKDGKVDGLQLDLEPYGAYKFDMPGESLCYCDDCFEKFLAHKALKPEKVPRNERYTWLVQNELRTEYLTHLRDRITEMFRSIATDVRAVRPDFGFSAYPDFVADDVRSDWRLQGMAIGLSSPESPFIVVNSTPYWENPTRPWWDGPAEAYRRLGIKHVMGSWDAGIMGHHNESHVGAADLMYEMAMASDGFWRWGEREYDTDDWRSFAQVNQKLRRVESRLGHFLFQGKDVPNFVTLVEQTGNSFLDPALFARTWENNGKFLVRIFNGNTDWPIHVRVRFPAISGDDEWLIKDPIHDVEYVTSENKRWNTSLLSRGLIVPIEGRGELFLELEKVATKSPIDLFRSVQSMNVRPNRVRPDHSKPMEVSEKTFDKDTIIFERSAAGFYRGETAGQALVTDISLASAGDGASGRLFGIHGYCRQPKFSGDSKLVTFATFVNGKGQIYVAGPQGSGTRNISSNDHCDRSPGITRDGKKIVFCSDRDGNWEIYSMNVDGSQQQRITRSPGVDREPSISPDGARVAFTSNRDGDFDVFVVNSDGTGERRVASRSGNEYEPIWSPDSQYLAYTVQRRQHRVVQISEMDGEQRNRFLVHSDATDLRSIRFSPDGKRIAAAFTNFNMSGIMIVDVTDPFSEDRDDKSRIKKLVEVESWKPHDGNWYTTGTGTPRMVSRTFSGISFSPDGKRIAYCSNQQESGGFSLYAIPTAGGESVLIKNTNCAWPVNTDWAKPGMPTADVSKSTE